MASNASAPTRITLHRDRGRLAALWRRRPVRWLAYLLGAGLLAALLMWAVFARGLPSAETLLTYEPPLPTNVRDIDGMPVQTFARERRVELAYDEYPPRLIQAFISAEDKTFFEHGGIDYPGIVAALISNLRNDGRPVGASTITQQVAKNLLLTNELSYTRKIKEAILARRIEAVLTKQQILELYLNQIFLGRNAYGVQSAARAYFNKDVDALTLPEMAYLAVLPKAPSNYSPERHERRAVGRRNYVLAEMEENGFISPGQRAQAAAQPLGTIRAGTGAGFASVGGYFMEEVRRELVARYGEQAAEGRPNSVYAGGLWVRSSMSRPLQDAAARSLRDGLVRFEGAGRWRDPGLSIELGDGWSQRLAIAKFGPGYDDWRSAVVLSKAGSTAQVGFSDGSTGTLPSYAASMPVRGEGGAAFNSLRPGMIIAVKREGDHYALRSVPAVSGGFAAEEVRTGRVLAMQGGWDVRGQSFNRATQALRQPGSTFKPIVYSAALDNGMTPASIVQDSSFCVTDVSSRTGQKCFRNFDGGGSGPQTIRYALEQSKNLMTVRTASQTGMPPIIKLADSLGVRPEGVKYEPYLSLSLGSGETTVLKMVNAFAQMANHGRALTPTLIDYVQDRRGKVILRADRRCERMAGRCNARDWDGRAMPRPPARTKQAMDPQTAYQMVHILEGVVERGTATRLRDLKRPLFGKTGTTTGPKDVWFVGGSPDVVAGLYLGYDQPRDLGGGAQGGRIAVPIFKQWAEVAYKDVPPVPFTAPAGVRLVRIDRRSGRRVHGGWPTDDPKSAIIWEAFKAETEPQRTIRRDEAVRQANATATRPARRAPPRQASLRREVARAEPRDDFLEREGGIY